MSYLEEDFTRNIFGGIEQIRMHADFGEEFIIEYFSPP
jgi:hypothetical protein